MNVRTLLSGMAACTMLAACCSAKDLVDNGDFKRDLPYWRVYQHNAYTPAAAFCASRWAI